MKHANRRLLILLLLLLPLPPLRGTRRVTGQRQTRRKPQQCVPREVSRAGSGGAVARAGATVVGAVDGDAGDAGASTTTACQG